MKAFLKTVVMDLTEPVNLFSILATTILFATVWRPRGYTVDSAVVVVVPICAITRIVMTTLRELHKWSKK